MHCMHAGITLFSDKQDPPRPLVRISCMHEALWLQTVVQR